MSTALVDAVRRRTEADADLDGVVRTAIPGMMTLRVTAPTRLRHALPKPLICLVLQGTKQVTTGGQTFSFRAGDSMLVTADVPTATQITVASRDAPYLSFALYLDPSIVSELAVEMKIAPCDVGAPLQAESIDPDVSDAALQLIRLLDRPAAIPSLHKQRVRELHYWLLAGRLGRAIRSLGSPNNHAQRVGRAVGLIRAEFARPLPIRRLAAAAGMSVSSFHHHFRAVTSLSPLQFQKQLRLIESRRLMLSEGSSASRAAMSVGYESVTQFTREYGRLFGLPPAREVENARSARS